MAKAKSYGFVPGEAPDEGSKKRRFFLRRNEVEDELRGLTTEVLDVDPSDPAEDPSQAPAELDASSPVPSPAPEGTTELASRLEHSPLGRPRPLSMPPPAPPPLPPLSQTEGEAARLAGDVSLEPSPPVPSGPESGVGRSPYAPRPARRVVRTVRLVRPDETEVSSEAPEAPSDEGSVFELAPEAMPDDPVLEDAPPAPEVDEPVLEDTEPVLGLDEPVMKAAIEEPVAEEPERAAVPARNAWSAAAPGAASFDDVASGRPDLDSWTNLSAAAAAAEAVRIAHQYTPSAEASELLRVICFLETRTLPELIEAVMRAYIEARAADEQVQAVMRARGRYRQV
jgi:hypothetical protein